MKKILCLFLTVIMLTFSVVPIYGTETNNLKEQRIITPMFQHIHYISAGVMVEPSGKSISFGMAKTYDSSQIIELNLQLQRFTDKGWTTIKNWVESDYGKPGVVMEKYWYVVRGSYRTAVTVKVYNSYGQLLENKTEYSPIYIY